jgi:hypothetical protein
MLHGHFVHCWVLPSKVTITCCSADSFDADAAADAVAVAAADAAAVAAAAADGGEEGHAEAAGDDGGTGNAYVC